MTGGRWRAGGTLALLALSLFLLKTVPSFRVPASERVLISDTDSLLHLRLAQLTDANFPAVPAFDPYLEFPRGAVVPWSFLSDLVTAALHRVLPDPDGRGLLLIAFLTPAAVSSLSLFLAYLLGRALGMGRPSSLLAAFLAGIAPPALKVSSGGNYDHHAWDLLWAEAFFLLLVLAWREGTARSRRGAAIHAGLALVTAAMFLNWVGAVLYPFMAALACLAAWAAGGSEERARLGPFFSRMAGSLGAGAAALALALAAAYGLPRVLHPDALYPGGFQPLVVASLALLLAAAGRLFGPRPTGKGGGKDPWFLAWSALALASLPLLLPTARKVFLSFIAARDPSIALTTEFLSPFAAPGADPSHPAFSLAAGAAYLTFGVFLFPLALALLWREGFGGDRKRGGPRRFPLFLFLAFGTVQFALALARNRFAHVFCLALGLACAALAARFFALGRDREGRPAARAVGWAGAVLVLLAFLPGAWAAGKMAREPFNLPPEPAVFSAAAWLAEHTPPPSDPFDLRQKPAYGVMAPWPDGAAVVAVGRRPIMATPLQGMYGDGKPFRMGMAWYLEPDPAAAHRFLVANRMRYVLVAANFSYTVNAAFSLGRPDLARALLEGRAGDLAVRGQLPVSWRLAQGSGVDPRFFRLVWEREAPTTYSPIPQPVRIYEVLGDVPTGG